MTWQDDFFGCNWDEYADEISTHSKQVLRKEEVDNIRKLVSRSCAIGSGISGAPFSMGGTLALSAYETRCFRVAHKKLRIIQAELTQRGFTLHPLDWKDVMIPITKPWSWV
jgi:hypothetical protein